MNLEEKICIRYIPKVLNFGDAVTKFFIEKLTSSNFLFYNISDKIYAKNNTHYLTIGSILTMCTDKSIIWGSGFISQNSSMGTFSTNKLKNKTICIPNDIILVRGPLTHKKLLEMGLNIYHDLYYGDPLMLFPLIYNPKTITKKYDIGIIPHCVEINSSIISLFSEELKNKYNLKVNIININTGSSEINIHNFINNIVQCDTIISSSLHGVIMGIIYSKKVIYKQFSNSVRGGDFKFNDFFGSINVSYKFNNNIDLFDNIINYNIQNVNNTQKNIIQSCPFINEEKKKELTNNLIEIYK